MAGAVGCLWRVAASTQVAEWRHTVQVLLQIYAKCLAGQAEVAREQIRTVPRSS